jgi:type IV secretory pathway component VirB8
MNTGLIIFLIVLFAIALVGTFFAFRQEENKMKKYEEDGDTPQDEIQRSLDYEKSSLKSNVSIQVWIYVVAILLSLLAFAIYLMI